MSAKQRLLAATLSCTLGFGVLTASTIGYWYGRADRDERGAALVEAADRGHGFLELEVEHLAGRARIAASTVANHADARASLAMHQLRADHPEAWIMLADARGKVLASSREQGPRESLLGLGGVRDALQSQSARALWLFPDSAWMLALSPVIREGETTGIVALGKRLDERFASRLSRAAGTPVWLSLGQRVIASDSRFSDEQSRVVAALGGEGDLETLEVADAGDEDSDSVSITLLENGSMMRSQPFLGVGGQVAFYASSADGVMQFPWWRLWLLGLLGVVAGLINWQRLAGGLMRIVDKLVYGLFEAGEGRHDTDIDFDGERGYFLELTSAYRRMQHELRQRIDNLTRAAEHKEQAMQAKDKFLASISHELRTPLTSVRAYAELLLNFAQDGRSDEESEFLRIIQSESERLTRLIDEVLDLTRIEARTMKWQVEEFDLRELVDEVIETLSPKSDFKSIDVQFDPSDDSFAYRGDRRRIGQAFEHVLDNAIKFSPVGGDVRLELSQMLTSFELRVLDSGPGIPGEAGKSAIFEKFYQQGEALTDRPDGTGLGLALSREILAAHAGTILCEDAPGGGAAFVVRITKAGECRRDVDVADGDTLVADAFALWSTS